MQGRDSKVLKRKTLLDQQIWVFLFLFYAVNIKCNIARKSEDARNIYIWEDVMMYAVEGTVYTIKMKGHLQGRWLLQAFGLTTTA